MSDPRNRLFIFFLAAAELSCRIDSAAMPIPISSNNLRGFQSLCRRDWKLSGRPELRLQGFGESRARTGEGELEKAFAMFRGETCCSYAISMEIRRYGDFSRQDGAEHF